MISPTAIFIYFFLRLSNPISNFASGQPSEVTENTQDLKGVTPVLLRAEFRIRRSSSTGKDHVLNYLSALIWLLTRAPWQKLPEVKVVVQGGARFAAALSVGK